MQGRAGSAGGWRAGVWCAGVLLAAASGRCGAESAPPGAAKAPAPPHGGTAIVALGAAPQALMPYAQSSANALVVLGCVFATLAETDSDLVSPVASLARTWEWGPDDKTLTFHLRDDLRWEDGVPVTAEDVQFSQDVARDSLVNWRSRAWKKDILSCDVVDAHTVRFRFGKAGRENLRNAKEGFVLPKHLLASVPRANWATADFGKHPVGCGPFKFDSWEANQRIILVRNPNYWDQPRPYLDRLVFEIVPDSPTRLRMLQSGQLDVMDDVPPREAARMRDARGAVRIATCRGRDYDYLAYNLRDPLLQDRRVRQALTLAIDRDAIIRSLCFGYAEPLAGPVVPVLWGYDPSLQLPPHDVDAAKRLLSEAGWRDSDGDGWLDRDGQKFAVTILLASDNDRRRDVVVPVQSDWKSVGVQAEVQMQENETARGLREAGKFQVALGGWVSNISLNFEPVWGCNRKPNNFIGFCNPRVDSLNTVAQQLPYAAAKPLVYEVQRLIAADFPYTFLYSLHEAVAISQRLQGVRVDARGAFVNPDEWWVTDAGPKR